MNLGNKIENIDINDSFMFAFVKVNECLRFLFEGKLTNEALIIIRKDLDKMRLLDTRFNNRLGIIDFD